MSRSDEMLSKCRDEIVLSTIDHPWIKEDQNRKLIQELLQRGYLRRFASKETKTAEYFMITDKGNKFLQTKHK